MSKKISIILLQDIDNLGDKYEIKQVALGYARNFLFPQKLAKLATQENLREIEKIKKNEMEKIEEELKRVQELASKLDGLEVTISVKVGKRSQLFESITATKITERLKELGFPLKKGQVALDQPIKEIGEWPVKINLSHGLEGEIKVIVAETQ